jgi:hypothetical protein
MLLLNILSYFCKKVKKVYTKLILLLILYYNNLINHNLYYKKGELEMLQSPVEFFRNLPKKICAECGQNIHEQAESYLLECDRCLAKKQE